MKEMKEKGIIFVVGLLMGAIIATGAILVYTLAEGSDQMNGANPGGGFQNMGGEMGTPLEIPNGSLETPNNKQTN